MLVPPNLTWLVIEDAYETNDLVEEVLKKSMLKYYYLIGKSETVKRSKHYLKCSSIAAPMPAQYKNKTKGPKPRGVSNRNKGIEWIRENAKTGVFYFADDDNTYDLELFNDVSKDISIFSLFWVSYDLRNK